MPICPKCKKEIDGLRMEESGNNVYDCWYEDMYGGGLDYQHDEFEPDGKRKIWTCPDCCKVLFMDEEKAEEFLMEGNHE
jgi:hypothetical protein